jgi:hypothetical protein
VNFNSIRKSHKEAEYKRTERPMFPFDKNMAHPDLKAELLPLPDKL